MKVRKWKTSACSVGLSILILCIFVLASPADAADGYYKGKVFTVVCGSGPGVGTDLMARMIARHLPRFLPGHPRSVIRTMTGAAGTQAPNYLYSKAKPNGLTAELGSLQGLTNNIFRPPGVEYKYQEMPCLLGYMAGNVLTIKPQIAKDPSELMKAKGLVFGGTDPTGSSNSLLFVFAKELIGFPVEKSIWGYTTAKARLAFITGEVNCYAESILGYRQSMVSYVEKGEAVPILQGGIMGSKGNIVRDRMGPDVPTIPEFYKEVHGKMPSGPLWEACKSIFIGSRAFSKFLVYPPKTPENILEINRKAIRQMLDDEEFKKEAKKLAPGDFLLTEEAPGLWESVAAPSPEAVEFAKKMFEKNWGVKWN